ncbi:MAG: GNAT family N-acetyltransferase [Candidatus Methanoperedens sp.]|nr:GNAT family N-acetyltransferase [Candidatus Methanoperedens sp.]
MASNEKFIIRTMQRDDVDSALDRAAKEGWNPGIHDADRFYYTDPRGFFIGEIDGEPIGCIAAVAYNESFGFIGLYIVKPGFRGKGYGIALWKSGMNHLGNRTIGLDGVIDQQENYKKSGFRLAYHNIRYEGIGEGSVSQGVVDLTGIPFEELVAYDSQLFSVPRPQFLKRWINQPEGAALGFLKRGKLAGYGVIRACHEGFKIGPLFADEEQIAEDLFNSLTGKNTGETVFLDTPEANPAAIALAKRHGMTMVFETARMYNKKAHPLPLHRIFGVTSLELG